MGGQIFGDTRKKRERIFRKDGRHCPLYGPPLLIAPQDTLNGREGERKKAGEGLFEVHETDLNGLR